MGKVGLARFVSIWIIMLSMLIKVAQDLAFSVIYYYGSFRNAQWNLLIVAVILILGLSCPTAAYFVKPFLPYREVTFFVQAITVVCD